MNTIRKVLVLGFSVTGEKNGYVEQAIGDWPLGVTLVKAAIGGLMPSWIKFFAAGIFDDIKPDAVVFDLATPMFRKLPDAESQHRVSVEWMLHLCQQREIAVAFLDLPRTDVDEATDWVYAYHCALARKEGLGYKSVFSQPNMFRDEVHPTESGKIVYSEALRDLICEIVENPKIPPPYCPDARYSTISIAGDSPTRNFSRAGFTVGVVDLVPGESIVCTLTLGWRLVGLSYLMGPRTGFFTLSGGGRDVIVPAYDKHCYFERFGVRLFHPIVDTKIKIEQMNTIPDVDLLKGEPDLRARVGSLAHLLVEQDVENSVL